MATIRFQLDNNSNDEINTYLSGRYISAPAAIWQLFSFGLIQICPPSMRLPVRLLTNNYRIISEVGQPRVPDKLTELEAFFELNKLRQNDPQDEF
jgi:hypothetical protein